MTVQQSTQQLLFSLFHIYEEREARNIADLVMESVTGWKRIDRVINKHVPVSKDMEILLAGYTQDLLRHKPVQYVLNEAWFYDMKFYVDEGVLIPRPETEELVRWVVEEVRSREKETGDSILEARRDQDVKPVSIIDIGTGSGCIAIALKKKLPAAQVCACDVSKKALDVSARNALSNKTNIEFALCDFLHGTERNSLPLTDIIVSNPPYIPRHQMGTMLQHVTAYEPHLALFVEDNDPLLFYKEIAGFAKTHLTANGQIFVELHEEMARGVSEVFQLNGFEILELRQDMQGKNRMLKATGKQVDGPSHHP